MGRGRGGCRCARSRRGLWDLRRVACLTLALEFSSAGFCRHRPWILTAASIVGRGSKAAATISLTHDVVDGSSYPLPTASVAARDSTSSHGDEERENAASERDAEQVVNDAQQRYPPAYLELLKGLDHYVRMYY